MRQLLAAISGALAGAADRDTAAILAAVIPAGSAAAADPALEALLPPAWKELAERTHAAFDTLATAVRRPQAVATLKDTVLVRLSRATTHCAACHEMFRVTVR